MSANRKLAAEVADNGLLAPELAQGISVRNPQCAVSDAVVTAESRDALHLTINIKFDPSFKGRRNIYARARDKAGCQSDPSKNKVRCTLTAGLRRPRAIDKELLRNVWEDLAVSDNSLARVVTLLRKVLADDVKIARYIEHAVVPKPCTVYHELKRLPSQDCCNVDRLRL